MRARIRPLIIGAIITGERSPAGNKLLAFRRSFASRELPGGSGRSIGRHFHCRRFMLGGRLNSTSERANETRVCLLEAVGWCDCLEAKAAEEAEESGAS